MILSPNNTPILDIEEFTSQYPNHNYATYFDSNGEIKESIYKWKLGTKDQIRIIVTIDGKTGECIAILPKKED